jgi:hypothetical protein
MAEVINLNRYRKARAKQEQTQGAAVKRQQFGQNKVDKRRSEIERAQEQADLDGKKLT